MAVAGHLELTALLMAMIALGVVVPLATTAFAHRDQAGRTSCPVFLEMDASERAAVPEKMGYHHGTLQAELLGEVADECQALARTGERSLQVRYVLGP